ncbi:carboxymuconolactone decarboxylase family protein [Nocardioides taihuensis]|uniref:Carboxymuconolactone decarboxylase family protein n=1 Tax=Nocardioides taihuensis TaxID=1835606 RepID=A0ABW0BH49_9ACTN
MPSTFRIPKAPVAGLYGRALVAYARRTFGQVPDGAWVYFHHLPLLKAVYGFERKVARWDRLDPTLKAYAELASAATIGCSWCMDFGYYVSHTKGLDLARLREVPRWRESDVFSDTERAVIAYAEAMSQTPLTVTDGMVADLLERLGAPAVVELTQMVALENMRSRFNSAAGLQSQGFSDVCDLPLTTLGGAATGTSPTAAP